MSCGSKNEVVVARRHPRSGHWTATPAGALVTRKDPLEYLRKLRFFMAVEGERGLGL